MVAGKKVTGREKDFICKNKADFSYCHIAKQLGELFPEDNQGSRDRQTVKYWARRFYKEEEEDK